MENLFELIDDPALKELSSTFPAGITYTIRSSGDIFENNGKMMVAR